MTRFNNKYPYTDFHELNADWLLETVKDAEAEAKEAADTVATYNDRLTTVEGDLAPIKSAMPGIASSISDLTSGLGRVSSQVTTNTQDIADNASNIDNIEDRLTTYDQNFIDINNQFISDQGRIRELETYRTEAQVKIGDLGYSFAPLFDEDAGYNAGDYVMSPTLKLHRARVNIPAGTANIHDLTQFQPTDINNALHDDNWVDVPLTAGTNVTINSYYCKRKGNLLVYDVMMTINNTTAPGEILVDGFPSLVTGPSSRLTCGRHRANGQWVFDLYFCGITTNLNYSQSISSGDELRVWGSYYI